MTRAVAAVALVAAALLAASGRGDAADFDFLYIRAHEGSASGGHAALRFGDFSFDFQHDDDGWLAPRREDSRRFQHEYRSLQNRSIEVSRIAATPETVALLRDTFERRLLAQSRQLEIRDELRGDVALLEALAVAGELQLEVRGAGFFDANAPPRGDSPPVLAELRTRIAERYGADWLAQRRATAVEHRVVVEPLGVRVAQHGRKDPEARDARALLGGTRPQDLTGPDFPHLYDARVSQTSEQP